MAENTACTVYNFTVNYRPQTSHLIVYYKKHQVYNIKKLAFVQR